MNGPCCTTFSADGTLSWEKVRSQAPAPVPFEPPPQLNEGMVGIIDLGGPAPNDIGRVFTYVDATTQTWTEHWVLEPGQDWFSDDNRRTRLTHPRPQPQPKPWLQLAAQFVGWSHAAVVYQYTAPPAAPPLMAPGTVAYDVSCTGTTTPWQGRLFRTTIGPVVRDRWILFSGYVRPTGLSSTELAPATGGSMHNLFADALANAGTGAEYVDTTYVVVPL